MVVKRVYMIHITIREMLRHFTWNIPSLRRLKRLPSAEIIQAKIRNGEIYLFNIFYASKY